jgi:hypothetical protein
MDRETVLKRLRAHEPELRGLGVRRLSLFGSVARGDASEASDVDLAAEFDPERRIDLFDYGRVAHRLEQMLQRPVDLLTEPARRPRMQIELDRDRVLVF